MVRGAEGVQTVSASRRHQASPECGTERSHLAAGATGVATAPRGLRARLLRDVLVAVRLVTGDGALKVAVLRARQEARLVEGAEALFRCRQVAGHQIQLARILERAAVLG